VISAFAVREGVLGPVADVDPAALPTDALWLDLLNPTGEEEKAVERLLGVGIPTRQEMAEIEESARLYEERGALVMTAVVVTGVSERRRPTTAEVTFVLTPRTLVTVRYADPLPFRTFAAKCRRDPGAHDTSELVFLSLVENIVNRLADLLEATRAQLDILSEEVFEGNGAVEEMHESRAADRPGPTCRRWSSASGGLTRWRASCARAC
jgi:magnesium transporter